MRRATRGGQQFEVVVDPAIDHSLFAQAAQRVTLETAPGTRMDVHLQGITTVVEPETAAAPTTDPSRLDDAPGTEYRADDADPRPRRDDLA